MIQFLKEQSKYIKSNPEVKLQNQLESYKEQIYMSMNKASEKGEFEVINQIPKEAFSQLSDYISGFVSVGFVVSEISDSKTTHFKISWSSNV